MLQPDYKEFSRLAKDATLIPVVKSVTADLMTPVSAFLSVAADEPYSCLLESVEKGEQIGRYTFVGARPYMRLWAQGEEIHIERGKRHPRSKGNVFETLKKLLREHRPAHITGLPPFTAGAVGYFAYDAVRRLENIGTSAKQDVAVPDCMLMFFDRLLAFDHLRHQIHIIVNANVSTDSPRRAYNRALKDIARIEKQLATGLRPSQWQKGKPKKDKLKVHTGIGRERYMRAVERSKEYIAAGDIFQVVMSQRVDFQPDVAPFNLYRALRTVNPSPYMYFLRMGDTHVLGSSPEMLVRVNGSKLEYRPIAGTRPRGKDEAADRELENEMRHDEKERAEHVMLVDLGRNDVGRVSEIGSVKVTELMVVERYSHVMHIVSNVVGKLREGCDAFDAFAATFPQGTVSGAPKIRAMQIIDELESVRRGVYAGAVGYFSYTGNTDTAIALRTLLIKGNRVYIQAGGGVVADSDPGAEFEESVNKARAMVRALQAARDFESAAKR